jgi:hypothetical protein
MDAIATNAVAIALMAASLLELLKIIEHLSAAGCLRGR